MRVASCIFRKSCVLVPRALQMLSKFGAGFSSASHVTQALKNCDGGAIGAHSGLDLAFGGRQLPLSSQV